jgi:hypothetical protein
MAPSDDRGPVAAAAVFLALGALALGVDFFGVDAALAMTPLSTPEGADRYG